MGSLDNGKEEIVAWVKEHFPKGSTCLDVGACDGKWHSLLGDWLVMDAVEIFAPSIDKYGLRNKYRNVWCVDIADYQYEWYDLILFGDVIEHMSVDKAQKVLDYAKSRCRDMIVSVPFQWHQDGFMGNRWEKHIQEDLTPELFKERYPGFIELCRPLENYAYYIKAEEPCTKTQDRPFFSVIVPTYNGEDRIRKALDSVRQQTCDDYELIVVCDSCTDRTAEIAREYTQNVVEVDYHLDGLTRNKGLDLAKGEWVLFLDDDDWYLHEYVFSLLRDMCGKHGEDMIDFAYIWKGVGYENPRPEKTHVMAWCRCWRREFIGSARFSCAKYGADVHFYRMVMKKKPNIVFWNMPLYYYNFMRPGSLTDLYKQKIL